MLLLGTEFYGSPFARLSHHLHRLVDLHTRIVELPPVFTYRMEELMDHESTCCMVSHTEMLAKTVAYMFFRILRLVLGLGL